MNRLKSSKSLTNLASSIKNHILNHNQQTNKKATLYGSKNKHKLDHQSSRQTLIINKTNKNTSSTEQQQLTTKTEIHKLQKQLEYEQTKKIVARNYDKQLQLYEFSSKRLQQSQVKASQLSSLYDQLNNRWKMIYQDYRSKCYNVAESIAQKQYYEDVIKLYRIEYEDQSELVLKQAELNINNQAIIKQIKENQKEIQKLNSQINQWKISNNYDLNQNRNNGVITEYRLQLMLMQQKIDQMVQDNGFPRLRHLICMFVQKYKRNKIEITNQNQLGIQLYICRQKLIQKLKQFVDQKMSKCSKQYVELVNKFMKCLQKIERVVMNSKMMIDRKILDVYYGKLAKMIEENNKNKEKIRINEQKIKNIQFQLSVVLNNQSLIYIEYIKDSSEIISLETIKCKLKQVNNEQINRINKIKIYYVKCLQPTIQLSLTDQKLIQEEIKSIQIQAEATKVKLKEMNDEIKIIERQKDRISNKISDAVQNWKQNSQKKKQLKQLYRKNNRISTNLMERYSEKQNIIPRLIQCQMTISRDFNNIKKHKNSTAIVQKHKKSHQSTGLRHSLTTLLISKLAK